MLLLFRMGDFYELFHDDAVTASRLIGLTLTSRDKVVPMAGFRHQDLDAYLRKLLHAGQRVAICDQVEDAALAKGLVKREVTRVVTAGTLTEDDMLDPEGPITSSPSRPLTARPRRASPGWTSPPVSFRPPTCRATNSPTNWAG